jgi:4-hydroxy-3-polyprenylbenzoate decarboxylase
MIAIALNRIYTPILRQQVSEIVDFFADGSAEL